MPNSIPMRPERPPVAREAAVAAAAALVLAFVAGPAVAPAPATAQQPSFGPLTWEEGAPLQRLAFTPAMEGAEPIEEGAWRFEVYNGLSNIFEQDSTATHVLFIDMERLTSALTVRWGARDAWELGARVTMETTGAGVLDGFVLSWHERWGFGNANRDRFPLDEYGQRLTDGDGTTYLDKPPEALGLRDVRLFGKWAAWRSPDRRSVLSLRAVVRFPTHGPLEGNASPDGSLMALGRLGMGSWYAHGVVGVSVSPVSPLLDPVLVGRSRFVTLGAERSLGSGLAALAQLHWQSAALDGFEHRELDRGPTSVLLGVAGRVGSSWWWNAGFQEDVPADTPAVDFTLMLTVGRTF